MRSGLSRFPATDEHTRAVAMYIEGLKDGARFFETLKRVVPHKPVAILKGGRTEAGQKSAASHTGSMAVITGCSRRWAARPGP